MSESTNMNQIPEITDPMGKNWRQPSTKDIEIDDTHALMSESTLKQMPEYSCSIPSGVYPGKMWIRKKDYHDESKGYWLCWFGESDVPGYVSNHHREIIVA